MTPGGPRELVVGALLFDNDGVLVDSVASGNEAWTLWSQEHDLDPEVVLPMIHGRRAEDTVAQLVEGSRVIAAVQRINRLELATAAHTTAMPGALRLLESLGDFPWAVVTSAIRPLAIARLHAAGLPLPRVLVSAEQVAAGKPAPDGYRAAAERLGVATSACVVLEDAPAGVEAGYAAGVAEVIGVALQPGQSATSSLVRELSQVSVRHLRPDETATPGAAILRWGPATA